MKLFKCKSEYSFFIFSIFLLSGCADSLEKIKKEHCSPDGANDLGITDAVTGKFFKASVSKFNVCSEDIETKNVLLNHYQNAFKIEFCQESNIKKIAKKDAEDLKEKIKKIHEFEFCKDNQKNLFKIYKETYSFELRNKCSSSEISYEAISHAQKKQNISLGLDQVLGKCPIDLVVKAAASYKDAFDLERKRIKSRDNEKKIRIENILGAHENERDRLEKEHVRQFIFDRESLKRQNLRERTMLNDINEKYR